MDSWEEESMEGPAEEESTEGLAEEETMEEPEEATVEPVEYQSLMTPMC